MTEKLATLTADDILTGEFPHDPLQELRIEWESEMDSYRNQGAMPKNITGKTWVRAIVWDKTQGRCWYCGERTLPYRTFTVDHLIPRSKGGGDDFDNLVPSCKRCNSSKGGRSVEYLRKRLALLDSRAPTFSKTQVAYLEEHGVALDFLQVEHYEFYFERTEIDLEKEWWDV